MNAPGLIYGGVVADVIGPLSRKKVLSVAALFSVVGLVRGG
jgi:hypothetical protein